MKTVVEKLENLRNKMKANNVQAYIICTEDYHGSEYAGDYFKEREYMSGFTGSARIRELRYSFREADKAFAGRFVQEPNQIISVEQLNFEQQDNEFDANIFGEINQFNQIITRFLSNGSLEEVESFVGALFTEISEDHFRSLMIRQYIIMDIYATVLTFCKKLRKDAGVEGEVYGQWWSCKFVKRNIISL